MRRSLVVFVMSALLVTVLAPATLAREPFDRSDMQAQALTPSEIIHANKSLTGRLAESDPDLIGRTDRRLVNVMVKFDFDPVASYRGGVEGLRPTSPAATGRTLKQNAATVAVYRRHIDRQAGAVRRAIRNRVPGIRLGETFLTAYGGVSARLPARDAKRLLGVEGVAAVQYDRLEQLTTDVTPDFIGASSVWPSLGGSSRAGEGVIVGVLDSGIWPEHPSFADPGISHPGGTYECDFGDGSDPDLGDPFTCNDKLIGAYTFVDTYLTFAAPLEGEFCNDAGTECTARDANGHGSHTAGTAAGSPVASAELLGVERGPISGIAPGAHIIAYRVCLDGGCFSSDSVAAVEQAIEDGVDVINFSISGGANAYSDSVELAFLDAYAAGIVVNASAGNDGPGAATANHAGPWTNTVGASTSNRHFLTTLELTAGGGASLDLEGASITDGAGPAPVILAEDVPGYTDPLCQTPLPADSAVGMIVACERGVIARVDKSLHVEPSGAVGMILYNLDPARGSGVATDAHHIPSVHIDLAEGADFLDFFTTHTGVTASWDPGTPTAVPGDVMAGFSSRGPVGDFIKPDVTAPGVQILAANTPVGVGISISPPGEDYAVIQGTSMSSPHAAGVAALLKDRHPSWSPGQIKSAMMTSSRQAVLKENGVTRADPFDRGAGTIRANRAVRPSVTFDVDPVDFYLSAGDALGRIDLNLASVNAPSIDGEISTTRTFRNVSGVTQRFDLSATGPGISVLPRVISVPAREMATFTVTINATQLANGQHFGQITINPRRAGHLNAVLPVAFNKEPGAVTLTNSCESSTVVRHTTIECELQAVNTAAEPAHVSIRARTSLPDRLTIRNWSDGNQRPRGFAWAGTLGPSLGPEIVSLDSPGDGFFDFPDAFGLAPVGGFGDETIANLTGLSAFRYGNESYTSFGITSNGYLVVGGGEAEDVDFVPHEFPDPVRPNNVLAPYWTDLNPADGGAIYVAEFGCGGGPVPCFYAVQWDEVPLWGSEGAETRTFQVWIMTAAFADFVGLPGDDYITFEYPAAQGPGTGDGLLVGAENRDASSGVDLGLNVEPDPAGYYVNTGVSTPGGIVTITYDVRGKRLGPSRVIVDMRTDLTSGTTRKVTPVRVVRP